jgi:hypothetical protein
VGNLSLRFFLVSTILMAPSQPAGVIKIHVPRLNSAKIPSPLATEVESVAKEQRTKVYLKEVIDPSSPLALAIVRLYYDQYTQAERIHRKVLRNGTHY